MPPPNLSMLPGFERATELWRLWKAGHSIPGAADATGVLFASSCAAMGIAAPPGTCQPDPLGVQFLAAARPLILAWLQNRLGVDANQPVRLYRGLRHQDAQNVRTQVGLGTPWVIRSGCLWSFTPTSGVAVGFARKRIRGLQRNAQQSGLVVAVDVQQDEIVMAENAGMCPDLAAEDEIAVILRAPRNILQPQLEEESVAVAPF